MMLGERIEWAFEISQPFPRDIPTLIRLYLLIHHKQLHSALREKVWIPSTKLGTKYSNIWAYGSHSHPNHHTERNIKALHRSAATPTLPDLWLKSFYTLRRLTSTTCLASSAEDVLSFNLQSEGTYFPSFDFSAFDGRQHLPIFTSYYTKGAF